MTNVLNLKNPEIFPGYTPELVDALSKKPTLQGGVYRMVVSGDARFVDSKNGKGLCFNWKLLKDADDTTSVVKGPQASSWLNIPRDQGDGNRRDRDQFVRTMHAMFPNRVHADPVYRDGRLTFKGEELDRSAEDKARAEAFVSAILVVDELGSNPKLAEENMSTVVGEIEVGGKFGPKVRSIYRDLPPGKSFIDPTKIWG